MFNFRTENDIDAKQARASLDTRLAPETNDAPHQPWRRLEPGPPIGEEAHIP